LHIVQDVDYSRVMSYDNVKARSIFRLKHE